MNKHELKIAITTPCLSSLRLHVNAYCDLIINYHGKKNESKKKKKKKKDKRHKHSLSVTALKPASVVYIRSRVTYIATERR